MTKYKLYYFPIRGRGEAIRLMFLYKGVNFEDDRILFNEWDAKKDTFPLKTLPVLEVDGKQISQSWTIFRYLGKKLDLAGKDDAETAHLEQIMELWRDFDSEVGPWLSVLDGFIKQDRDLYMTETIIPALDKYGPRFERILQETGSGFFGKTGPTYVDFYIAECIYTFSTFKPKTFQTYFHYFYQHMRRVHALPGLQKHLKYYKYTHPPA